MDGLDADGHDFILQSFESKRVGYHTPEMFFPLKRPKTNDVKFPQIKKHKGKRTSWGMRDADPEYAPSQSSVILPSSLLRVDTHKRAFIMPPNRMLAMLTENKMPLDSLRLSS